MSGWTSAPATNMTAVSLRRIRCTDIADSGVMDMGDRLCAASDIFESAGGWCRQSRGGAAFLSGVRSRVERMSEMPYIPLPEGLADLPPGPGLGAALAEVDRAGCNGFQLVELVQARHRQLCWEQAQLLADLHELAYAPYAAPDGPPRRSPMRDPHAAEEVSFALAVTMRAAEDDLALAFNLFNGFQAVYTALAAGRIDLAKTKMLLREVDLLHPEQAAAVLEQVLATIEHRSYASIRDSVRRLVLSIDPALVRRRYTAALARRTVYHTEHPDGTTTITGRCLPKDTVAAVFDYLNRLTAATQRSAQPRDRTADQVRADIFLDLLRGIDPTRPATDEPGTGATSSGRPAVGQGSVHLTVELTTLMHLNDRPGELAGFGPVIADIARQVAASLGSTPMWRFQVTHDGRLVHEGRLHYRPTADQKAYVRARDQRCQAPGCRRPAHQADIDHIRRWHDQGATIEDNLTVLCRRHHRAKDGGGFRLRRTDDGLAWTSPRGHTYPVRLGRELTTTQRSVLQTLIT
jgi:hypothetical protein